MAHDMSLQHLTTLPQMDWLSVQKEITKDDIETRLVRVLYHYRTTSHTTTGRTPGGLLTKEHDFKI